MIDVRKVTMHFSVTVEEIEDIKRCLNMLYSTRAGTIPLDREFGLKYDFLGVAMDVAKNEFALEVISKTERYEPRVKVEKIEFSFDESEGRMIPAIYLSMGGEK